MKATPVLKARAGEAGSEGSPVAAVAEMNSDDKSLGVMEEELYDASEKLAPKNETVMERGIVVSAPAPIPTAAPATAASSEVSYIDSFNQKRNLVCSHTKAVVNDAVCKAQTVYKQERL